MGRASATWAAEERIMYKRILVKLYMYMVVPQRH